MKSYMAGIIIMSFTLASCKISGLTSGFSSLPKGAQERVVHYKGAIDDIRDFSNIYAIGVEQTKDYLTKHEKIIIYDFTPFCKSGLCVSPLALSEICKRQNIDLLVISNIYDDVFSAVNKNFPILMIDTDALQTKWRGKYIEAFYYPLIGRSQKEINYASYLYFHNGTYVRSFKDYREIEKAGL